MSFIHALFLSDSFRRAVDCTASGMVMSRMVVDDVLDLHVPVYTPEEQRKVAAEFDMAYAEGERLQQQATPLVRRLRSAYGSVRLPEDPSREEPAIDT